MNEKASNKSQFVFIDFFFVEISYSSLHGYSVKGNPPIDFESDSPLTLNVSLLADTTTGKTSALVEWDHPPIFFKDPIISYDVHLFFNGCNEYPSSSPPCHKTTEIISTVVISKYSQKVITFSHYLSINYFFLHILL